MPYRSYSGRGANQRDALVKIMAGQETEDMATMGWIYSTMSTIKHEPVFHSITLEVGVDARTAPLEVPDLVLAVGQPIRNPVRGAEHRVRIPSKL
jgi:hypothetical protein